MDQSFTWWEIVVCEDVSIKSCFLQLLDVNFVFHHRRGQSNLPEVQAEPRWCSSAVLSCFLSFPLAGCQTESK